MTYTIVAPTQKIEIDISIDEIVKLSEQQSCDRIDLCDKILSTFTWHDQRSLEGKIVIIKMLQKHIDVVLKTIKDKDFQNEI